MFWNFSLISKNVNFGISPFFEKAIKFYKEAFKLNPKNDLSLYNIGNIYSALKKFEESIRYFKKAIEINPSNFRAYN